MAKDFDSFEYPYIVVTEELSAIYHIPIENNEYNEDPGSRNMVSDNDVMRENMNAVISMNNYILKKVKNLLFKSKDNGN